MQMKDLPAITENSLSEGFSSFAVFVLFLQTNEGRVTRGIMPVLSLSCQHSIQAHTWSASI